jgi:hypothetical protein
LTATTGDTPVKVAELAPAAPVAPVAPPAVPDEPPKTAGGMQLVRLASNMYELKIAPQEELVAPAAAPAPVAAAVPPPAAVTKTGSRLEIANGNGATGLAKRFRQALATRGIAVTRLTNAKPFGRAATSIEFRRGFEQQARGLQATLGGKAVLQQADKLRASTDVRLVLGKDADLAFERSPDMNAGTLLTSNATPSSINH